MINFDIKTIQVGAAEVVRLLKAKRRVWLMFLQAKGQQQMIIGRLLSLKTIK